jgi:protein-tyrosine-phosphatase
MMELNGRLWGSLPLTISAGLDYPFWLYQLTLGQDISVSSAKFGIRQRHLGKDLFWLTRQLKKPGKLKTLFEWIIDFRHFLSGTERFDVETLRDPMPGITYWWQVLNGLIKKIQRLMGRKWLLIMYRRKHQEIALSLEGRLKNNEPNILFLCRGNICRSAFAERYLKSKYKYLNTRSAGTISLFNRKTPHLGEKIARKHFNVDMDEHLSKTLDDNLIKWADLMVVMDEKNYFDINTISSGKPVLMLGGLINMRNIDDPFNKGEAEFFRSFQQISQAIDMMWGNG